MSPTKKNDKPKPKKKEKIELKKETLRDLSPRKAGAVKGGDLTGPHTQFDCCLDTM